MKVWHGTSIVNLIKLLKADSSELYVTDTPDRAARYANAQATEHVSTAYERPAPGTAILEIESELLSWSVRGKDHNTLDTCEAVTRNYRIVSATIRWFEYENTAYDNHMHRDQVKEYLALRGIEVIEVTH